MSFGEHLEELRKCLVWAFIWLGIGMAIALPMATWLTNYIQSPLRASLIEYYNRKTAREIEQKTGKALTPAFQNWLVENKKYLVPLTFDREQLLTILEKADATPKAEIEADGAIDDPMIPDGASGQAELDVAMRAGAYTFREPNVDELRTVSVFLPVQTNTEALGLQEPFMIWLKAGFVFGFVLASPGIFHSIWAFVSAGLYPHERKHVYLFLPISVGLFLFGAGLAFFFVFKLVIDFLLRFNDSMGINASPRLTDYMSFALFLPLGFGVAFQLPLVMVALERVGITSVEMYLGRWREAIVLIAFLSMILTPAEPTSMIALGTPLAALYFLGIGFCRWLPRGGSPHVGYDPQ